MIFFVSQISKIDNRKISPYEEQLHMNVLHFLHFLTERSYQSHSRKYKMIFFTSLWLLGKFSSSKFLCFKCIMYIFIEKLQYFHIFNPKCNLGWRAQLLLDLLKFTVSFRNKQLYLTTDIYDCSNLSMSQLMHQWHRNKCYKENP